MSGLQRFVLGLAVAFALSAAGTASAYHTNFVATRCNSNPPTPIAQITRDASTTAALRARWEGYQWGGGCWNDNDVDDSPGDPTRNGSTGGEGGDCSGFTFKIWRESGSKSNGGYYEWHPLRFEHGPYLAEDFKVGDGAPNATMSKADTSRMDALASPDHIGMIYARNADGSDLIIEAKGETAETRATAGCAASVGHPCSRTDGLERRMLLVVLVVAALLLGCSGEDDAARPLLDGSASKELAAELEGVDGEVVVTAYAVLSPRTLDSVSPARVCLEERFKQLDPDQTAVRRTAVSTESVTFVEPAEHAVFGCTNTAGPREGNRRWCGGAYGEITSDGRLDDPRLSIICETPSGAPVGSVWIRPGNGTRYVAVEQPDYTEVYEVAGGLPIRIATVSGVDVETSSATFEISEHDADGKRLREQTLEAFVAG